MAVFSTLGPLISLGQWNGCPKCHLNRRLSPFSNTFVWAEGLFYVLTLDFCANMAAQTSQYMYICVKGTHSFLFFFSQWLLVALVEWSYGLKTSTVTLDLQPWPAQFSGVTVQLVETILCVCVCLGPVELASCRQMREKNNKYTIIIK